MNNLFVFLPCYNEEDNIGSLIEEWMKQKEKLNERGFELLLRPIDDCSKDNTKKIIEEKAALYPENVALIAHKVNKNLRGGLNTGICYFLENAGQSDYMAFMDGDNTHNPKYIHSMFDKLEKDNLDCVIASRYCGDSGVVGVAAHREFFSDMAKIYYSLLLKVPGVKDYTCGYRLYNYKSIVNLVKKYGSEPIKEKSFACMMEFLYKLHLSGSKFGEVGFELRYDNKLGESKMNVFKTAKDSLATAAKLRFIKK